MDEILANQPGPATSKYRNNNLSAQDRDSWRTTVNAVMKLQVS
jgi:hypothetical protein